jgi:hypothetical protein
MLHHEHVPWKPDWSDLQPDPRLDPYRHRAALLIRDGVEVGCLYAEPEYLATQDGGHLWWRSYTAPREMLKLWWQVDGSDNDAWSDGEELTADLAGWRAGRFQIGGQQYECTWLDDVRSDQIRRSLGLNAPDR